MIGPAASVASAAGVGCLAAGLGCFAAGLGWFAAGLGCWLLGWGALLLGWGGSCRAGCPPVGLEGSLLQIGGAWLQIGLSSRKAGWLLLSAINAGLIHENQPTVCKGTAFSWNKYQK